MAHGLVLVVLTCWVAVTTCDAQQTECSIAHDRKRDCGYPGIQPSMCTRRGCCWAPTNQPNTPWCYTARVIRPTTTPTPGPPTPPPTAPPSIVRLYGGDTPWQGLFQVDFRGGQGAWHTICNRNITASATRMICRSLGYSGGYISQDGSYVNATEPYGFSELDCAAYSAHIRDDCTYGDFYPNCTEEENLFITCDPEPPQPVFDYDATEGDVRIIGSLESADSLEGRLEILHNHQWGTVCDDGFGEEEALVVCRSLNYDWAVIHGEYQLSARYKTPMVTAPCPIWMDAVKCPSDAHSLLDCEHKAWGDHDCKHREDVGFRCEGYFG